MKILFLTLLDFATFSERNIYCDLLREFMKNGHEVYGISPLERRTGAPTHWEEDKHLLKLSVGNIQKTSLIEKGISTLRIESQFRKAIKAFFPDIKFDLILYSTPPITFLGAIRYVKKRDGAKTYLLLKDIFPQNAVDLGMLKTTGVRAPIYRYFRKKEKRLYAISDRIGCMSQANVDYIIKNNPEIDASIVEVCPNCIDVEDIRVDELQRKAMRVKYGIPQDKKVFVYGGNLGKPQGIPFLIDCLRAEMSNDNIFFLIVGDGTEYKLVETFVKENHPNNVKLMTRVPKDDYDRMIAACDVGMIFLDHRFTIPNFPSRLLSYMQAGLPVLACTDPNTDIGKVIVDGGFGWWCKSDNINCFQANVQKIEVFNCEKMREHIYSFLESNYQVERVYRTLIERLHENNCK